MTFCPASFASGLRNKLEVLPGSAECPALVRASQLPAVFEELQEKAGLRRSAERGAIDGDKGEASGTARLALVRYSGAAGLAIWRQLQEWILRHPDVEGLSDTAAEQPMPFSPDYLRAEMRRLWVQSPDFPWSRLRSLADKLVKQFVSRFCNSGGLEEALSGSAGGCLRYEEALARCGRYWFRRSVEDHLSTGFHTAISANFKMLGMVPRILSDSSARAGEEAALLANLRADEAAVRGLLGEALDIAHYLATCHMELLHASDSVLWDSAGSRSASEFGLGFDGGVPRICLTLTAIESIAARVASQRGSGHPAELRTGCPALRVRTLDGSLVSAVRRWCDAIFCKFALPLSFGKADAYSLR